MGCSKRGMSRVRPGVQPELEVARFLTEVAHYPNTPEFMGAVEYAPNEGDPTTLAIAFAFVPNQGDAWNAVIEALDRGLEDLMLAQVKESEEADRDQLQQLYVFPLDLASRLGERTAELHRAFAVKTADPAFAPEPIKTADIRRWTDAVRKEAEQVFNDLRGSRASLPEAAQAQIDTLLAARKAVTAQLKAIAKSSPSGSKTRIHGDYHLGQVLISKDDVIVIDFEGEPRRSLEERREKSSPLRDVAGMLRSLDYAASAALERLSARRGQLPEQAATMATAWRNRAAKEFLEAYCRTAPDIFGESPTAANLLRLFLLQKAFYEIGYERANRPAWVPIPLLGVLDLLDERGPRWP